MPEAATKVEKASVVQPKQTVNRDTVMVTFRHNRKHDLHIGRNMVTFRARETKPIPKAWLKHPDWASEAIFFIVKGV